MIIGSDLLLDYNDGCLTKAEPNAQFATHAPRLDYNFFTLIATLYNNFLYNVSNLEHLVPFETCKCTLLLTALHKVT